jgi:hypothetical protein
MVSMIGIFATCTENTLGGLRSGRRHGPYTSSRCGISLWAKRADKFIPQALIAASTRAALLGISYYEL